WNPTAENNFLKAHVIDAYENRLKQNNEAAEKYDEVISEIKENIMMITDAAMANDFVSRIGAWDHVGNSKSVAAKLLKEQAEKLNLTFDKETKKYEAAQSAKPSLI